MEMTQWEKKQAIDKWHEKDKLFQLTDDEVAKLPFDMQYTRMRYIREIEGMEFVKLLSCGVKREIAVTQAHDKSNWVVANWNKIKKSPMEWS